MYNATEQFVELNKANVAQASKLAAITLGNAEKLLKLNLSAAKSALAQSVENAQAAASVKDVQELFTLRARLAESGVQTALPTRARSTSSPRKRKPSSRRSRKRRGRGTARASRPGSIPRRSPRRPARMRRQRVQVDVRRDDCRVRPVPEGDQAGREPRRCERSRRGRVGVKSAPTKGGRKAA